jgi:hypothetical protein
LDLLPHLVDSNLMFSKNDANTLDTSLFDPEHDLDLVAAVNNARTDDELRYAVRMSRNRMRSRRAALKFAAAERRGFASGRTGKLTPSSLLRG